MSELYNRIKQDIEQDVYYNQNFANDGERFLAWYLRNIYLRTPIQARDDITDGPNDKEIDAVIVDDDMHRVLIIQSKFYAGSVDHQPLQEVLAAWIQMKDLETLQQNANSKVQVKLAAVAEALLKDDYDLEFELVTTGVLTTSAQQDLANFQNLIGSFENIQATLTLVDEPLIKSRWDESVTKELPKLNHTLTLESGRYLDMTVAGFKTVLAAIPLSDCSQLPGIRDGMLFRKNVRQSLGLTNKVNKGLQETISKNSQHFFLFHNGITALCEKLDLDKTSGKMKLEGLSVVNGCQSLTTIMASSEKVRASNGSYVLFRFYEIPQTNIAEEISVNTNRQSAVKPRDLRSNDKRVLALKRAYENTYKDGFFITKRGEKRLADRDQSKTIEIGLLARCLMAWHCQRPNIAYNENKLFDKHFEQLFRPNYSPADLFALTMWANHIERRWVKNDLGLNNALLAMPSYSKYHLLFAVQACFSIGSGQADKVPLPSATATIINSENTVDPIITMAANCYNAAFDTARSQSQVGNKVFSPPNWLKSKDSVLKIQAASSMYLGMVKNMPGGAQLNQSLVLPADKFEPRWSAD